MNLIIRLLINAVVILIVSKIVPGFDVANIYTAIWVALILGIVNVTLKPIFIILTFPINVVTFGLFTFVINAFLLLFVSSFIKGFYITNFWAALVGALVISLIHFITNKVAQPINHTS